MARTSSAISDKLLEKCQITLKQQGDVANPTPPKNRSQIFLPLFFEEFC